MIHLDETTIELRGLRFYAYHGVLPQEQQVGAWFTLSVTLHLGDTTAATAHDELSGTVDYGAAYQLLASEMAQPSQLMEHVAARCLQKLFAAFPLIVRASLSLQKDTPPISGFDGEGCVVRLSAHR